MLESVKNQMDFLCLDTLNRKQGLLLFLDDCRHNKFMKLLTNGERKQHHCLFIPVT